MKKLIVYGINITTLLKSMILADIPESGAKMEN
jgi:hypothetical protein